MSTMARQQALLVAEAWQNLYANQPYVDFQAYTQDNLVNAILNYVQVNYPDNFNDWIANSEFIIKVKTLAWLHQNLSYRLDLNVRENFIQTATRRSSILNLAENVFYKPNRVTGASGALRISSISTNQPLIDSNNVQLANLQINWSDPANADWFEQFMLVMNQALTPRTQFGHPVTRFNSPPNRIDLYMLNTRAPSTGTFPFNAQVAGSTLQFEYINVSLDPTNGVYSELPPNPTNGLRLLYFNDGLGSGSTGTGFFLPVKQGNLTSTTQNFAVPQPLSTVTLGSANVDNGNIFVQQLDTAGNVIRNWSEVSTLYGQGVAFNTLNTNNQTIYETHTLVNDQVRVVFGDGKFGAIPTDNFKFWYRTVNPIPLIVNPDDIQNQTFSIPYVANNVMYFLTIRASLVSPIVNALSTDSNQAILNALGGSFAAQQRMITGGDYNLFPLSDPSILKLKAINRTYSGHSAYSKITDPTGFYSGIKILGEDGRLYRTTAEKSQYVSGSIDQVSLDELVLQDLLPLVQAGDKEALYYEQYPEVITVGAPLFVQTSESNGISFGNIQKSGVNIPVGATASDEFKYCVQGTILRYNDLNGPLITVENVVGDGTGIDAIELSGALPTNTGIFSMMPPLRNQFTTDEITTITANLTDLQDFGIGWNQLSQSWVIIENSNINATSSFDLGFQGDTTNVGSDASWMVRLRYVPNDGTPQWEILDRGLQTFFESAREVEFAYANAVPQVDPSTGKYVQDNINILGINEGRDSLHRLGLSAVATANCCSLTFNFTADGIGTCFFIRERVEPPEVIVLVNDKLVLYNQSYTIGVGPIGDSICFFEPPLKGSTISIRINSNFVYAVQTIVDAAATGSQTFFPIGTVVVDADNTRVAVQGITQHPGDYSVPFESGNVGFYLTPPFIAGTRVYGYAMSGPQSNIFNVSLYLGDGTTTNFDVNGQFQTIDTILVWIDGVWQAPVLDYLIDNTNHYPETFVSFGTAPEAGASVVIYCATTPQLFSSTLFNAIGDGATTQFALDQFTHVEAAQVMVGLDGVVQRDTGADYLVTANGVTFMTPPPLGQRISIFVLFGAVGINPNLNGIDNCFTTWLLTDRIWNCIGPELTPDGYVDIDGIEVVPVDTDHDGFPDDPYLFDEIMIPDGLTDLVLWRSIVQDGFSVWNPIDLTTTPQGSYGFQARTGIVAGVTYASTGNLEGDIHLDQTTGYWLTADAVSGNWIYAPDQASYMSATGRAGLKFIYTHYPTDSTRIDPAVSNIIDMFVLTVSYDTAYRKWIQGGFKDTMPAPATVQALQNAYGYFSAYKSTDDALIFHPIQYRPLFGTTAEDALQAKFLAIQTVGSTISTNDLVLKVINAVELYFDASNWDLGATFYFTEMVAFIHRACAPDLQSLVIVSKDGEPFGSLFQVRAAPDELFVSVAQPSDIEVVMSFNNDNLQITSL